MKTIFFLLLLLFSLLLSAQENPENSIRPKNNILKTNLTSIPFRNYQLTYERALGKRFSVVATYAMMPEGKIPLLTKFVDDEDLEDIQNPDDIQLKSNAITIETRLYMGKGYGRGFYLAPYYRYSSYEINNLTIDYPISLENQEEYNIPLEISGESSSNNVGLMIGVQTALGKKENWVIDAQILGAHYGTAKGNLHGIPPRDLSPEEQEIILQDIRELDIPLIEYDVTVNDKGANITLDGPWAGLRFAIALGYRF
ncbi:MAG: DUF3575 domain-containing protein [Flavobacteriaceae bacterium]|nr:DUF3575 domain-containing protein [Flavobacteriaceae bacterium]